MPDCYRCDLSRDEVTAPLSDRLQQLEEATMEALAKTLTTWVIGVAHENAWTCADALVAGPLAPVFARLRAGLTLADELEGRYLPMSSAAGQVWDIAAEIRAALGAPLGQHDDGGDSNTADELAAAGLRACCGQPSERHCL